MKRPVLFRAQKRENRKTCALYNFFSFPLYVYIYIVVCVCVTKYVFFLKIYARYILLVPQYFCILSSDFNVNNLFKYILSPRSVNLYYVTGDSESHFLKRHEYCGILSFKH
jgi:hypothetical protein